MGGTLNLTGSSNIGTSHTWSGPNSFISTLQNPSIANVTSAAASTYSLTAANGCTSTSATTVVAVNTPPTEVTITSNPTGTTICAGDSRVLTAGGGNISVAATPVSENFDNNLPGWAVTGTSSANVINWTYASAPYNYDSSNINFSNFTTTQEVNMLLQTLMLIAQVVLQIQF